MSEALWATRPRPRLATAGTAGWRGEPTTLAELRAMRMQLRELCGRDGRPPAASDDDVDRLLLAFEELVSNALRHGRGPVRAAVTTTGSGWLLEVSDAAGESPPVPAVDRDAALGGLGLYLVAQLSGAHGWTVDDDGRKVVWARVDVEDADDVGAAEPPADGAGGGSRSTPLARGCDGRCAGHRPDDASEGADEDPTGAPPVERRRDRRRAGAGDRPGAARVGGQRAQQRATAAPAGRPGLDPAHRSADDRPGPDVRRRAGGGRDRGAAGPLHPVRRRDAPRARRLLVAVAHDREPAATAGAARTRAAAPTGRRGVLLLDAAADRPARHRGHHHGAGPPAGLRADAARRHHRPGGLRRDPAEPPRLRASGRRRSAVWTWRPTSETRRTPIS